MLFSITDKLDNNNLKGSSVEMMRSIIKKEINWGAENYVADRSVFKKSKEEKELLKILKKEWESGDYSITS